MTCTTDIDLTILVSKSISVTWTIIYLCVPDRRCSRNKLLNTRNWRHCARNSISKWTNVVGWWACGEWARRIQLNYTLDDYQWYTHVFVDGDLYLLSSSIKVDVNKIYKTQVTILRIILHTQDARRVVITFCFRGKLICDWLFCCSCANTVFYLRPNKNIISPRPSAS